MRQENKVQAEEAVSEGFRNVDNESVNTTVDIDQTDAVLQGGEADECTTDLNNIRQECSLLNLRLLLK